VAALQALALKLGVGGHTDNDGTPASNQALSEARARSVMKYLTNKGIAQRVSALKAMARTALSLTTGVRKDAQRTGRLN